LNKEISHTTHINLAVGEGVLSHFLLPEGQVGASMIYKTRGARTRSTMPRASKVKIIKADGTVEEQAAYKSRKEMLAATRKK